MRSSPNRVGPGAERPSYPSRSTRRRFLKRSLAVGGIALLGGGGAVFVGDALGLLRKPSDECPPDPLVGGRLLGTLPFDFGEQAGPPSHVLLWNKSDPDLPELARIREELESNHASGGK